MTPFWHALISVHGVPARVHPRQRRIGPEVVLKTKFAVASWTYNVFFLLGVSTLDYLCGSLTDCSNFFLLSIHPGFCFFVSDRCS